MMPIRNSAFRTSLLLCMTVGFSTTAAAETQPPMSAPYTVENAQMAYDEVRARWVVAQQEQQARFSAFEGDFDDFVPSDPILQDVSWPYEICTDLISLIPPPMEGWGLRSDAPFTKNPVGNLQTEVTLVTYDLTIPTDDPDFYASERSVQIRTGISPDAKAFWEMALSQPGMRAAMFEPGPYNYPVTILDGGVMLGDVGVSVYSTDEADSQMYLEQIIGCAIKNGMIANGIDPTTLREEP